MHPDVFFFFSFPSNNATASSTAGTVSLVVSVSFLVTRYSLSISLTWSESLSMCNLLVTPRGGLSMLTVFIYVCIMLLKILGSHSIGKEIDCGLLHVRLMRPPTHTTNTAPQPERIKVVYA